ncbi:unnamed protein product [Brachionus calyciflorus]|uniref:Nucleoprotein TPR n=1 Tax=Brachionus calyciflorus TaxID=104777 RepID=A0A813M381_9BILA|nr:unnamed protein product [Brachionus calyciflorus]
MEESLQIEKNPTDENTQIIDDQIGEENSQSAFLNVNQNDLNDPSNPTANYKRAFFTMFELTDEELNKIEEHLKEKIVSHAENFLQKHDYLQTSYEKFKIECEQRFIELEAEYTECQNKLTIESKNAHLYQIKSTENEDKLMILTKQNKILDNEKETLISNQQRLNTVNQNLEAEKRDLLSLLDKKIKDNDRLNEEWKSINIKLTESESKMCELTAQLEEMKTKESTITFRERQFQSDKERLLNEIDWLNQQLKEKSMQLLDTKGQLNQKIYDLESKVEEYSAESRKNKSLIEALQNANQTMENQIEELTKKLQETREKEVKVRIEFSEESMQRDKLIELYKEENQSCKTRLEEAAEAIKELNHMISEAREEYSKLADEKAFNETSFEATVKQKDEMIAKLEQELKNANELLSIAKRKGATVLSESDIEQLSPAAAVASKLLKSGMTLTQIYSEYVNLTETLQNEKIENERLKSYISELINDIEEKAPVFRRQKQEYEEAIKTNANLTTQLENAYMDYEVLKSKSEDSIKKYNSLSSENMRLKQDISDMSRQVTVLLTEVEQLRSRRGLKSEQENPDSTLANLFASNDDSYVTSSSESRNKNAFMFRNIEELQKQNQDLKRLLNEITDKKQSEEKAELEMKTKEFNEKLSLAMRELEEFKIQREKQEQVLDEIRKQRDTYKHLLIQQQQTQTQNQPRMPIFTSTPGGDRIRADDSQLDLLIDQEQLDFKKKLDEANSQLTKLQKHFEKYQEEMSKNNKSLSEQVDTLRAQNSDLNMKVALSESKLESTLEKCKTLSTAAEKHRKELDTYKERASKSNELIIKHEQSINLTTQELNRSKEKINEIETKLHSLMVERDMFKSNYDRLSKEHELLIKENNSRTSILANLEMIRNSCDRNERETKLILNQKIEQLERELTIHQKQAEHDKEQSGVLIKSWQSQYEQLNQQRNTELADSEKLKNEYLEMKQKFEDLQNKFNEIEAKLHSNELLVQMSRNTKSSTAISRLTHLEEESKELQMKVSLADKEIASLKIQLEDSKAHAKQYKTISDTMEKTMREESEANLRSREIYEKKINDLTNDLNELRLKYEEIIILKSKIESEFAQEKENLDSKITNLEKEKKELISQVEILEKRIENLELILDERTKARDDYAAKLTVSDEQVKEYTEKINNLENNLISLNSQITELNNSIQSKTDEFENEKKLRVDQEESFGASEKCLRDEISNLKIEITQLLEQNNKLQTEFSKVGQDLVTLKKQDLGTSLMTDDHSSSNLLEINRYLRTQKEQLEEKYENLKLNHEITQQRLKNMENDLEFYKKQCEQLEHELKTKPQGEKIVCQTSEDNFNLILETNKRLKEELDSVNSENSRLNDEINKMSEDISNLKTNLNGSELKNESYSIENSFLKTEVKKLKERIELLYSQSDMAEEWTRVQTEIRDEQEKNTALNDLVGDLKSKLTEADCKYKSLSDEIESRKNTLIAENHREIEKIKQEFVVEKSQMTSDRQKLQNDFDTFKSERAKREEMFKTLVNELKDVVSSIQKEFQLKDVDWTGAKGPMSDRVRIIKEEISQIKKLILDRIRSDKEEIQKKSKQIEESQTDLGPLQKKLEESEQKVKEKETRIGQMNNFIMTTRTKMQNYQKQLEDLTKEVNEYKNNPQIMDQSTRNEFDQLKTKFAQSQLDNEKLKKDLASSNQALADASSKLNTLSTSTSTTSVVTSPSSSQTTSSAESSSGSSQQQQQQQQQQPPTAYIVPSRIAPKIAPTQPTQSQQQNSQNLLSLRRTAAVQPTPHVTQISQESQQQWGQNQEGSQTELEENRPQQPQELQEPTPSTSRDANSTQSGMVIAKRTREDDHQDENSRQSSLNSNNKKQRSSQEIANENIYLAGNTDQQQQQQGNIEQYSDIGASSQDADNNQYIVINDEINANEAQDIESQEEIVLDDDTAGSDGYEDVIITSSGNQGDENQNSNGSNYQQDDGSNGEQLGEEIEDDVQNQESNDIEEIPENLDNEENSGDIHLEIHPEDNEENHEVIEESDSQAAKSENQEEIQDSVQIEGQTNQQVESSQTNLEDKSNRTIEQTQLPTASSKQPATSTTIQTAYTSIPRFTTTSGTTTLEKPKPIVWDGPSSSTATTTAPTSNIFASFSSNPTLKIRRQTTSFQTNQQNATFQQTEPVQFNPNNFRLQQSQFRVNNSQFQLQNVSSTGQPSVGSSQGETLFGQQPNTQGQPRQTPLLIRGQRTQQNQLQTQTPGRILPQRGGANQPGSTRGGLNRGAGNANRGGRNF